MNWSTRPTRYQSGLIRSSPNKLSFSMNSSPRKEGLDFEIQKTTQLLNGNDRHQIKICIRKPTLVTIFEVKASWAPFVTIDKNAKNRKIPSQIPISEVFFHVFQFTVKKGHLRSSKVILGQSEVKWGQIKGKWKIPLEWFFLNTLSVVLHLFEFLENWE